MPLVSWAAEKAPLPPIAPVFLFMPALL